jgi:hypothetical protein
MKPLVHGDLKKRVNKPHLFRYKEFRTLFCQNPSGNLTGIHVPVLLLTFHSRVTDWFRVVLEMFHVSTDFCASGI